VEKSGKSGWTEDITSPLLDSQGKIVGAIGIVRDVTSRKQMEVALLQARDDWESTFDSLTDMVTIHDKNFDIIRANSSARQMLGLPLLGNLFNAKCFMCYHGTEKPPVGCPRCRSLVTEQPGSFELFEPHLNRYLEIRAIPRFDTHHQCIGLVHVVRDITERKQAEEQIQRERAFFDQLVETAPESIVITDTQGKVMRVNAEFLRMFGYRVDEVVGQDIDDLVAPPAREEEARGISESTGHGKTVLLETMRRRKDGTLIDVSIITAPVLIAGKQEALFAIYRDIAERKQIEQKLEEMATHDFLTGLPNRVLLLDRFTIAVALARRNKARLAIMSLDLDKFKSINDTLGHDAGDRVLKAIGMRLTRIVRASDTFARVGGDEFISVMMETDHMEGATAMAKKILGSFTEPLSIGGHQLHLSTSIGIAIYPEDAEDLETLTKKSDAAMYYSKDHGRNQFKFYSDGDVQIG
jgi:diguanylate cyclase (GGDEF)-like protein/PAS domain S-box-containing protein